MLLGVDDGRLGWGITWVMILALSVGAWFDSAF